ncbi:MAG TPA: GAF domain-containing sensor histidine kinase [Candidatus Bathyarchaeia archaeon]|nr:GAF domain-containing sensor histidine kinase [Candidatus Bathyarchaeia archaeon]
MPTRLRIAGFVLPSLLIASLVGLDYFVLAPLLPSGVSHLVMLVVGIAGVLAFSTVLFGRLSALQQRDREQTARLAALNAAGMWMTSELDTAAVLQRVVDQARDIASAKYAALGVFDQTGTVEQFITSGITPEERALIGPLPHGLGLLGLLQREPHALRLRDIKEHPASVGFPPNHPPMRSFLGTPILWRGKALGNLYLTEKQGVAEFTGEDEQAVATLAAQAAIAIENARLYGQAERVSVLEERHRIGMDLHDGAIQSLYGLGLLLEDAAARIEREPVPAREVVLRAVDRLNVAIADLRSYVLGLRPVRGSDRPLTESLATLAEQTRSNALLDVDVAVSEVAAAALDGVGREAAFYIAADALGNIARHARAQRASLRLSLEDSNVTLEIVDNGVGFDYARATEGHGLRNMRERAFAVGGQLHVDSVPGQGSRLRFQVPVRSEVR